MEKYIEIIKNTRLFKGIEEEEQKALLKCLGSKKTFYHKAEVIFDAGEQIEKFGIVLSGEVQIVQDDFFGNRSILGRAEEGQLFAEAFAFAEPGNIPVSVITMTDSEILFIDCKRFIEPCTKACSFHNKLILNMINIISMKNISLTRKIEFTSKHNTREKLLSYLSSEAKTAGDNKFYIPYNRQELADFLSVERSAMSAVLSKLRDEGVLKYNRNYFEIL